MNNGSGQSQSKHSANEDDLPQESFYQRGERHFWRRIASGFFVLVPLLATFLIIRFVFGYVDGLFRGDSGLLTRWIEGTVLDFPGVGVAFTIGLLYLIGLLVAAEFGRRAVNWQDAVLSRIPIVKSIYGVAKQATDSLVSPSGHQLSRVVFIEWPREGLLAIGFITGHCPSPMKDGTDLLVVYVPTVPNPTSGNLAFVSEDKIVESELTVEEAMKIVFSGGMVLPEKMTVKLPTSHAELPGA